MRTKHTAGSCIRCAHTCTASTTPRTRWRTSSLTRLYSARCTRMQGEDEIPTAKQNAEPPERACAPRRSGTLHRTQQYNSTLHAAWQWRHASVAPRQKGQDAHTYAMNYLSASKASRVAPQYAWPQVRITCIHTHGPLHGASCNQNMSCAVAQCSARLCGVFTLPPPPEPAFSSTAACMQRAGGRDRGRTARHRLGAAPPPPPSPLTGAEAAAACGRLGRCQTCPCTTGAWRTPAPSGTPP